MGLVVQKYGGTSVGNIEKIKNVARRIIETKKKGDDIIVIVSAMAGETDRLINLAYQIANPPNSREYDALVSTGEQVSSALLAMAIQSMGYKAKSFLGHQIKLITDDSFTKARIARIESDRIMKELKDNNIIVIAGFQGIDENGNITTLGRGGSDTTAVAIAAALNSNLCEIYTDVEGVYTTDPNICPSAKKLKKISYDEMLEMASLGAKVLQARSVELAKKYNVPLCVRSSFSENEGTLIIREDSEMEKVVVSGVTYSKNEAKISIMRVPDKPGIAARIFTSISDANIIVDMIIQNISEDGYTDLTFTVPKDDHKKALEIVNSVAKEIGAKRVISDESIAKVSIVGVGMRSYSGVASKMFRALANEGINIIMISTSEIKISCVIDAKYAELAVRTLHDTFELDKDRN
jgi:aspartate kinase